MVAKRKYWDFIGKEYEVLKEIFSEKKAAKATGARAVKSTAIVVQEPAKQPKKETVQGPTQEPEKVEVVQPKKKKGPGKKKKIFVYGMFGGKTPKALERTGYIYSVNGILLGLHKEYEKADYTVTDILTGMSIGRSCRTLKEVYDILTPDIVNAIIKAHNCNTGLTSTVKIRDTIRAAYQSIGVNVDNIHA